MLRTLIQKLQEKGTLLLTVKVRPNARNSAIKGILSNGVLKIDIAGIAEDGKANGELIQFLSREFGVLRSQVEIVSGGRLQRKRIRITLHNVTTNSGK